MEPKIGIIVCGFSGDRQFVTNPYIQSVRYSRGLPFILPLIRSDHVIDEYVRLCDGFLFCGGEDITPLLFGEEPVDGSGKTDITVDLFQIRLMKRVLLSRKPVLAICRGMQFVNVFFGGTLFQDIKEKQQYRHMDFFSRASSCHPVSIEPNSLLYRLWQTEKTEVNSMHHQAIETLGKGLRVSAKSGDGFAEAIETPEYPFLLGVQWHPEHMSRKSEQQQRLFDAFVRECANR